VLTDSCMFILRNETGNRIIQSSVCPSETAEQIYMKCGTGIYTEAQTYCFPQKTFHRTNNLYMARSKDVIKIYNYFDEFNGI